ncbi:MAG: hypothetical protein ACI94Y_002363 [Maribacter sp.]|jgi:hypothetical protein
MLLNIPFTDFINQLNIKTEDGKKYIWDEIRKKWYVLQPEEFVRQLVIKYLIDVQKFNKNKIQVEKGLVINELEKRFDILVYDNDFNPYLLIECKRPEIKVDQKVLDQISVYNIALKVPYLLVTNGPESYCCKVDFEDKSYSFIDELPKAK